MERNGEGFFDIVGGGKIPEKIGKNWMKFG